jgi:FkbM family methyltransferase
MKKLLKIFFGVKCLQSFYEKLFRISLKGMNIGLGSDIQNDGEIFVLNFVKSEIKNYTKPFVIFDVGANIGNYIIEIEKIFKPEDDIYIYAFEPAKNIFKKLTENVSRYSNINVYNLGLSNQQGEQILFYNEKLSGLSSLYKRNLEHFNIKMDSEEQVRLTTIDIFCKEQGIEKIDFLKLDIEGNEINALEGAKTMLEKDSIKFIQFEFGGCNIDSRTYFQDFYYLLKDRYKIYRILRNNLYEIENYNELKEIFITTNYLAIHK